MARGPIKGLSISVESNSGRSHSLRILWCLSSFYSRPIKTAYPSSGLPPSCDQSNFITIHLKPTCWRRVFPFISLFFFNFLCQTQDPRIITKFYSIRRRRLWWQRRVTALISLTGWRFRIFRKRNNKVTFAWDEMAPSKVGFPRQRHAASNRNGWQYTITKKWHHH